MNDQGWSDLFKLDLAAQDLLRKAFAEAVRAASPGPTTREHLKTLEFPFDPGRRGGHILALAFGKGAHAMAKETDGLRAAFAERFEGICISPKETLGQAKETESDVPGWQHLYATHPVPDWRSLEAATQVLERARGLSSNDLLLCLISGGASALLCAPWGVTLAQKAELTAKLLRSGASIVELNAVRKHLSRIKGGQLAMATRARVHALIVSDVVGDDLATIAPTVASGPTAPDPTTFAEAIDVLERYGIEHREARDHLERGARGELPETPKPDDPRFARVKNELIVTNASALEVAVKQLERTGLHARVYSDRITGSAREAAKLHAELARALGPNEALVSGGETTVEVNGSGFGGRNLEFLLALAIELDELPGVFALAADTDGVDGSTPPGAPAAAGGFITPNTLERARHLGLEARAYLHNNDARSFFAALDALLITGPTGTNVNDLRIVARFA